MRKLDRTNAVSRRRPHFGALGLALLLSAACLPPFAATQRTALAAGTPLQLVWSSDGFDQSHDAAWGDMDGDGDLDLAVANGNDPNRLYRNDQGTLTTIQDWPKEGNTGSVSVAWGDVDGDGDLDLAVGNHGQPSQLYRNDNGMLAGVPTWTSSASANTWSIAWGDVDGDGDLDLASGNEDQPNSVFLNVDGRLGTSPSWQAPQSANTRSVAWGDVDGDGKLDLAVGNYEQPNQLYHNDGRTSAGTPTLTLSAWSPPAATTLSVAWGDYNGDGRPDLAVGNIGQPNQLYPNTNGALGAADVWSPPAARTRSVAWGDFDGDGDQDLAVGNDAEPSWLYRNDDGVLAASPIWSSAEADFTFKVAWGDADSDGDLDLAMANWERPERLYRNQNGVLPITAVSWKPASDATLSVAWGDVDGDGDLDLATGNGCSYVLEDPCVPSRVYRNDGGALSTVPIWEASLGDHTVSVAWGDYDGDGELDLATGSGCPDEAPWNCTPTRVYHNQGGTLGTSAAWSSAEPANTHSVAWADYDGDGDLDLALGNYGQPSRIYRNQGNTLAMTPIWESAETADTRSLAWGDVDGDGDLDLALGNDRQPNRMYLNDGGRLSSAPAWASSEIARTLSVAWGDVDGDGDLDLAVGNYAQPARLYRNEGGLLSTSAAWETVEADSTLSVAWGDADGDGDLDLAAGGGFNRLYRNDNGSLTTSAAWSAATAEGTASVAWGDADGDGDLDLAVGNWCFGFPSNLCKPNQIYYNTRDARDGPASIPSIHIKRPGPTADADFFSSPAIQTGPTITFTYTLTHPRSLPVRQIVGEYSLDGGGRWLPAIAAADTVTTSLETSPAGVAHAYTWDVFQSGVMGRSDAAIFRLKAMPSYAPAPNQAPGSYLYGSYAASSFPFRVQGSQVRVMRGTMPEPGALVYRQPGGRPGRFEQYANLAGQPFRTDAQGYLQGRGEIRTGDRLAALVPISATDTYTLYYSNAAPTATGIDPFGVGAPGVQTLVVSDTNPLLLFNLDISLEWDARHDPQFLEQLAFDLGRTSEFLYDWTNGQAALGQLTIYHDRERWNDAHIRIYATNSLRPNANQGGIVSQVITDPLSLQITAPLSPALTYEPGQVRIGATWNRFGDPGANLGEDWPRTLAHELGHFALFLDDNYLGVQTDAAGRRLLAPIDSCPGAMSDPYRDDYSEFHPDVGWLPRCKATLSHQATGRADWSTIAAFYPALHAPITNFASLNAGPSDLPLAVTHLHEVRPVTPTEALDVPIFYLRTADGTRYQPGAGARAYLFRREGDRVTDLGRPIRDQVTARGARPGDTLCVYELAARPWPRLGCTPLIPGNEQLWMATFGDAPTNLSDGWQPSLQITPVTSRTLDLSVTHVPAGLTLQAQLFPSNVPALAPIDLAARGAAYAGRFNLDTPAFGGYIRLWVVESGPQRREITIDYALGGSPAHARGRDAPRGDSAHARGRDAPVLSGDGQVILFGEALAFGENEFYILQAAASVQAPPWATLVGQAYQLAASPAAPSLAGTSLNFRYLGGAVPPGEEAGIRVYFWEGDADTCRPRSTPCWRQLPTRLDTYHNEAVAPTQGPGLYALMSSIEVPLQHAGWNMFSYPVQATRPVTDALSSIEGYYTTLYGYAGDDAADPWKVYDVEAPAWVNDLSDLQFGHGYWINATQAITISLKGASGLALALAETLPTPPSTFYGAVRASPDFTPVAGLPVLARVGSTICGRGSTRAYSGQIVYVVDVLADGAGEASGCGIAGRAISFQVGGTAMATHAVWENNRPHALALSTHSTTHLPFVGR